MGGTAVRRATALRWAWGVPVIWAVSDELPATLTATAEPVLTVRRPVVVRHLHLTPGGDAAGLGLALPPGSVVTTTGEE